MFFKNFLLKKKKYTLKSQGNYAKPFKKSKLTQFSISYRGPHMWNNLLDKQTELKSIINPNTFKQKLKVLIISTISTDDIEMFF